MNSGDAVVPQFLHLPGGLLYSQLSDSTVVVGVPFQLLVQFLRDSGAAEGGEPPDLGRAEYGQDAGHDGNVNAGSAGPAP